MTGFNQGRWLDVEEEQLKEFYPIWSQDELEKHFNRSFKGIQGKASKLKIKRPTNKYKYEQVQKIFEDAGCLLLSDEYSNNKGKLTYVCLCGEEHEIILNSFLNGTRCKECGIKNRIHPLKRTQEEIEDIFTNNGCRLLSEYINNKTPLRFLCKCRRYGEKALHGFLKFPGCRECGIEHGIDQHRNKYEDVQELFLKQDCELLEKVYINVSTPMRFECSCGDIADVSLERFTTGARCEECNNKNRVVYNKKRIKEILENEDCKYISHEEDLARTEIVFECSCGKEENLSLPSFRQSPRCWDCREKRYKEKVSGANNCNWNPNKTNEERQDDRKYPEYQQWRRKVYERDGYSCQCCGDATGGNLNAHHKDGYHWCEIRRLDVSNGVTLCDECHATGEYAFHKVYGNRSNAEEQYNEWIKVYQQLILKERSS